MNDMHLRLYQVSLNGQLTFSDIDTVKAQLSKDYRRVGSDFDPWFIDEETILKKNVSYCDAENFARYFEKLGLEIKITKMTSTSVAVTPLQYTSSNIRDGYAHEYLNCAGFLLRFMAYFIDKMVLVFLFWLSNYVLSFFGLDFFSILDTNRVDVVTRDFIQNIRLIPSLTVIFSQPFESQLLMLKLFLSYLFINPIAYLSIMITIFYYSLMQSLPFQGTIGALVVGIKTVGLDGNRIKFMRALSRTLLSFFSFIFFFIGYLYFFCTKKRQCLHDKISKTYVVFRRKDMEKR